MHLSPPSVTVQVIIPARNEEGCILRCLESLAAQQGISFEIIVVDDGSTDDTRAIAESVPRVRVIEAGDPGMGISGKCNALIAAAKWVTAEWVLFTDADTVHYPGSLAAAVSEAEERGVDLLSYSPEQETGSWYDKMLMPVVYAELTRTYPTEKVNDPADPTAAANGQYILVRRCIYEELGGHAKIASKLLEDVELARLIKRSGHRIWFRFGAGRVRTRMYRTFAAMWEGWTKNLAILFPHPLRLALMRLLEFSGGLVLVTLSLILLLKGREMEAAGAFLAAAFIYGFFLARIRRAHFPSTANMLSFCGLPLFALLLARSWLHSNVRGAVTWKGRKYGNAAPQRITDSSIQK
jgi:glycosyltransferase involved in cell wall biosynthesis